MELAFWIKRFLAVAGVAFAILLVAELTKGHAPDAALEFALLWSLVTAAVFVAAAIVRVRRNRSCALCGNLPATPPSDAAGTP
jgi:hypothetical protein